MAVADTLRAPRPADIVISLASAAVGMGMLLLSHRLAAEVPGAPADLPRPGSGAWWLVVVVILGQCLMLVWARHAPRTILCAVTAAVVSFALTLPGPVLDLAVVAVPLSVFLTFRSGNSRGLRIALVVVAGALGGASYLNSVLAEGNDPWGALGEVVAQLVGLLGIPLLLATVLRTRQESRDAQRRELQALRRERDALVDATVARERTAMARELHDIAAHHLSGIALMAAAVQRQVHTDPDSARTAAEQIRAESIAVLQNLRRVVGMLRVGDAAGCAGGAELSVESFAAVAELVAEMSQKRGMPVHLELRRAEDEARPFGAGVGPLAQLAAYRTIQESLTNAATHAAGAACTVCIDDSRTAEVWVEVRNTAAASEPSSGGGFGLVGMRERADLVGARLSYGRTRDGGWEVRLRLPRDATIEEFDSSERAVP